jgi:hypothetical protein
MDHLITCPLSREFGFHLCQAKWVADMVPTHYETLRGNGGNRLHQASQRKGEDRAHLVAWARFLSHCAIEMECPARCIRALGHKSPVFW